MNAERAIRAVENPETPYEVFERILEKAKYFMTDEERAEARQDFQHSQMVWDMEPIDAELAS